MIQSAYVITQKYTVHDNISSSKIKIKSNGKEHNDRNDISRIADTFFLFLSSLSPPYLFLSLSLSIYLTISLSISFQLSLSLCFSLTPSLPLCSSTRWCVRWYHLRCCSRCCSDSIRCGDMSLAGQ